MSRFHRIRDVYSMPGPHYFRYAERLFAYDGVLAARVRSEVNEQPAQQPPQQEQQQRGDVLEVEPTAAAIAASPLGQIVSIAQV